MIEHRVLKILRKKKNEKRLGSSGLLFSVVIAPLVELVCDTCSIFLIPCSFFVIHFKNKKVFIFFIQTMQLWHKALINNLLSSTMHNDVSHNTWAECVFVITIQYNIHFQLPPFSLWCLNEYMNESIFCIWNLFRINVSKMNSFN